MGKDRALESALEHQWERELPRGSRFRMLAVAGLGAYFFAASRTMRPELAPALPVILLYGALALFFLVAPREFNKVRRWSAALLDIPMCSLVQHSVQPYSTSPGSLAIYGILLHVIAIFANPAIVFPIPLAASCLVGLCCGLLLVVAAGAPASWLPGIAATYVFIWAAARFGRLRIADIAADYVREHRLAPFFSSAVADELRSGTGGEGALVEATVIVSDIRGFTTLAESLPADEVVRLLNEYLVEISEVVATHGGTVDKFLGDGMLAYFTDRPGSEGHAVRAVRCAQEMLLAVDQINEVKAFRGERALAMGVGLHTGPVIAGAIGSERRREHTIIGDTVNVAARIEGLTKDLGPLLVSETVRNSTGETFSWVDFGKRRIRGRSRDLAIYQLVSRSLRARPGAVQVKVAPEDDEASTRPSGSGES